MNFRVQLYIRQRDRIAQMPEHAAHVHVQRALHSLLLEDEQSAAVYLQRALSSLRIQQTSTINRGSLYRAPPQS